MTTEIIIKAASHKVAITTYDLVGASWTQSAVQTVAPGESQTVYVHSTRKIEIQEMIPSISDAGTPVDPQFTADDEGDTVDNPA